MTTLRARDLMTAEVITVPPETPVLSIARMLAERGISAVAIVDAAGKAVGVVTESDLVRRLAGEDDKQPGWFGRLFSNPERSAEHYARTHGVMARDIMTTDLVTVDPEMLVSAVAHLMEERRIRRVLVTQEGRLRGILSRADLLRALAAPPVSEDKVSDDRIRRAVMAAMRKEPWADTFYTLVDVKDGVVDFHGFSRGAAVQRGLRVLAENVPGVRGVQDNTQPMPPSLYGAS